MLRNRLVPAALLLVLTAPIAAMRPAHAQDAMSKLGRGIANVSTAWVEVPKNVNETIDREKNFAAGMTRGLGRGVGKAVLRVGAGLYEIFTFPFPGEDDYEPFLTPAYVFSAKETEPSLDKPR